MDQHQANGGQSWGAGGAGEENVKHWVRNERMMRGWIPGAESRDSFEKERAAKSAKWMELSRRMRNEN